MLNTLYTAHIVLSIENQFQGLLVGDQNAKESLKNCDFDRYTLSAPNKPMLTKLDAKFIASDLKNTLAPSISLDIDTGGLVAHKGNPFFLSKKNWFRKTWDPRALKVFFIGPSSEPPLKKPNGICV